MAYTLNQLKADVLTLVKRPDLVADIELHTKNAILKVHQSDYYKQDLKEFAFSFAEASPVQSLEIRNLVPRFRKMKYMNTIDPTSLDIIRPLSPLEPTNFLDAYGHKKDYVFYEAGDMLQIRVSDSAKYFNVGVYLLPDTTLLQQSSWIADALPMAIVYEACRTLFKAIGFDEQSAAMDKLGMEMLAEVKALGIPTVGE